MKRLEKLGNYLVITDTVSGVIEIDRPTKDIQGRVENGRVQFHSNNLNQSNPLKGHELYLFGGVAAIGSVQLTGGAAGSVNGITVNAIPIMSGAVAFLTDLATTAANVAANINANVSTPNYTAVAVGALITITAEELGGGENGNAVVSTTTTITSTNVNMEGGTTNLVKTGDAFFNNLAELVTFVRANTGA